MTADELVDHAPAIDEPNVQYDDARRRHHRAELLAHVGGKHQDWKAAREARGLLSHYSKTELHPSTADPAL